MSLNAAPTSSTPPDLTMFGFVNLGSPKRLGGSIAFAS